MEDRYLFKAKRVDNGEWVKGYFVQTVESSYIVVPYKHSTICGEGSVIEIDKSTICQCTGLKDKNGNLIWENDIVGYYTKYEHKWHYGLVGYGRFNCSCCDGVYGWHFGDQDIRNYYDYKVKGNIFDNPELLEGE